MKPFLLFLALCACFPAYSQKTPQYNLNDLITQGWEVNDCEFDPEAEAIILYKEGSYDMIFSGTGLTIAVRQKRLVRILDDEGLEEANLKIHYYPNKLSEIVKIEKAVVYNRDENGKVSQQEISKENTFTVKDNPNYTTMKVAAPNVRAGSIVYYEYTINSSFFRYHYFQESLPVLKSVMKASHDDEFQVNLFQNIYQKFNRLESNKGGRTEIYIEVDSIIGLKAEPYGDNYYLYVQKSRMLPRSYNNGEALIPSLGDVLGKYLINERFGSKLKANINNEYEVQAVFHKMKSVTAPVEKAKFLYNYIRDNYIMTGSGDLYFETSLSNVLSKKKGTQTELAALYYKLLVKAGLKPNLVLTTTNDEPPVDLSWPTIDQFSALIVKLEIDGKTYFNNPVYSYVPFEMPPRDILNTAGIELLEMNGRNPKYKIVSIESNAQRNINSVNIFANLNDRGLLQGKSSYFHTEYGKVDAHSSFSKDSINYSKAYEQTNSMKISNLLFQEDADNSLMVKTSFDFEQPTLYQDGFLFIPTHYFTGFPKNPFTSEFRKTAVYFSSPISTKVNFIINIDPEWEIESIPKNIRLVMHDQSISYTRRISQQDNQLNIQVEIAIHKSLYDLEEYDDFYEFWKMLFEKMDEKIVVKHRI